MPGPVTAEQIQAALDAGYIDAITAEEMMAENGYGDEGSGFGTAAALGAGALAMTPFGRPLRGLARKGGDLAVEGLNRLSPGAGRQMPSPVGPQVPGPGGGAPGLDSIGGNVAARNPQAFEGLPTPGLGTMIDEAAGRGSNAMGDFAKSLVPENIRGAYQGAQRPIAPGSATGYGLSAEDFARNAGDTANALRGGLAAGKEAGNAIWGGATGLAGGISDAAGNIYQNQKGIKNATAAATEAAAPTPPAWMRALGGIQMDDFKGAKGIKEMSAVTGAIEETFKNPNATRQKFFGYTFPDGVLKHMDELGLQTFEERALYMNVFESLKGKGKKNPGLGKVDELFDTAYEHAGDLTLETV